jgi:beta-alanine--pyruvate transaminase
VPNDLTPSELAPNALAPYWMPFTSNRAFKKRPRLVSGAEGMHYLTPDGRRVLDATSGLYCVNAGHGRKLIVEAIQRTAATLDYAPAFQFGHPAAFQLASRLALMAPGDLDRVFFATSGSEAVDTALKIALAYWRARGEGQRMRLIGRERGYHGAGFGGISVGGMVNNRRAYGPLLPAVDHLATTYDRERQRFSTGEPDWGGELAGELERLVALHDASTIAAVIVEPVAGSTGCLPPPKGYLERLRAITAKHSILLIFDEVITAFGRLGHAFAAERYGVVPDMICFAKGMTNGAVPMSGVVVRQGIHDALMQGPEHAVELYHGYTYSGHPLGTAAALAALDLYRDEGLFARAGAHEAGFAERMMSLRDLPHVADIRPIGMMCGIDLDPRPGQPGARGMEMTDRAFFDADMYVRVAGDTIVVAPPLVAAAGDLDAIRDRLAGVLRAIT